MRSPVAFTCLVAITGLLAFTPPVGAGIGPENVVVVVNGDSRDSRTLANHYAAIRRIPANNLVVLDEVPGELKISLEDFKTKILQPVLNQIAGRGLANQVRVIAYSADFPTAVDISSHTARMTDENVKKYQRPTAAITGLTFFYRFVLADDPSYLNWYSNLYARGRFERHFVNPFTGEKGQRFEEAMAESKAGGHEAAAEILGELFDEFSTLSPLALRACEEYAAAGDLDAAKQWLAKAIGSGWWSATYLGKSERLRSLVADPEVTRVVDRLSDAPIAAQGPTGFAATRGYTGSGHWVRADQGGVHYMLSCMLGVVHPRGSTVGQATDVLRRAATADLTQPRAVVGFSKTKDVRTETRFPNFGDALLWLAARDRPTNVISTPLPTRPASYVGLVLGTATMNLDNRPWRFVPGAIAESLTSTGGAFDTPAQTKLTELLHAGAAMSSGAVAEPYSLQFKFPLPIMHAYYAEGVSAIEAFYLSVTSPYQLLIVGEPICQPFAKPPGEMVRIGLAGEEGNRVAIERQKLPPGAEGSPTREIRVFVEGKLVQVSPPVDRLQMNLPEELSGVLETRVVLTGHDPTEPRLGFDETIELRGPHPIPTITVEDDATDSGDRTDRPGDAPANPDENAGRRGDSPGPVTRVRLRCPGADRIEVRLGAESVGQIEGDDGSLTVRASDWGDGPLRLRPFAQFGEQKVPGPVRVIHAD